MKRLLSFLVVMCICTVAFSQEEQLLPTPLTQELHDSTTTLPSLGILLVNESIGTGNTSSYTEGVVRKGPPYIIR